MAASDRMRMHRIGFTCALLGAATLVGCGGEFVHSNPFDPAVPVTLRIEGPDKTVAQFDTVRFKLTTDPAYDFGAVVWSATGGLEKLDENGTFRAPRIGLYSGPVQITAALGPRKAQTTVMVTYQPASFRMYSCADSSRTITITALDTVGGACATVYDARGGFISSNSSPPLPIIATSLDTSIATINVLSSGVRSVRNGTTRVVYRANGISDTLNVVVRQRLASLTLTPPPCPAGLITMKVGSTVQLNLSTPGFDATGHPMADTTEAQAALASARWWRSGSDRVTVSPDGLVTAVYPYGGGDYVGYSWQGDQIFTSSVAWCFVMVEP